MRIMALGQNDMPNASPRRTRILFLCVENSARSQIAEHLARDIFGPNVEVQSAGSMPTSQVHPLALEVLADEGLDISHAKPKRVEDLDPLFLQNLDYVITLCHDEVCPTVISPAQKLHWPLPDPDVARKSLQYDIFSFVKVFLRKTLKDFAAQNHL